MKFRSVNFPSISWPLKQLSKVSMQCRSQEYLFEIFCKLLSKNLWENLYLVKFHAFSMFFWIPSGRCVWRTKIILWDTSYFRTETTLTLQKSRYKNFWWNYESSMPYISNKREKWLFLVFPLSDMHIHWLWFCGPFLLHAQPGAKMKSCFLFWGKFVQPWAWRECNGNTRGVARTPQHLRRRALRQYLQKQPPELFYKKVVLRNFAKLTGKNLCQSPFI